MIILPTNKSACRLAYLRVAGSDRQPRQYVGNSKVKCLIILVHFSECWCTLNISRANLDKLVIVPEQINYLGVPDSLVAS